MTIQVLAKCRSIPIYWSVYHILDNYYNPHIPRTTDHTNYPCALAFVSNILGSYDDNHSIGSILFYETNCPIISTNQPGCQFERNIPQNTKALDNSKRIFFENVDVESFRQR